jgi:hypothetical protein
LIVSQGKDHKFFEEEAMTNDQSVNEEVSTGDRTNELGSKVAVACAVLGVITAVWVFWLIVPGVIFGVVAVVLGIRARRRGDREMGSVAVALGIAAVLLVPSVILVASDAENWGRDCALNPTNPDC